MRFEDLRPVQLSSTGQKNTFSVFDSTGKELMPAVSIASSEEIKGDPWLDLNIGWPTGKSFDVYGCGTVPNRSYNTR